MHPFFDRHMHRVGLVGVKGFPGVKLGNQGQVVGTVAVQEVSAGFQADHTFDFPFHAVKVFDQLGNLILEFILDLEHDNVTDHLFCLLCVSCSTLPPRFPAADDTGSSGRRFSGHGSFHR